MSPVSAPLGFQLFALQHPEETTAGADVQIDLSPSMAARLRSVNRRVNTLIAPRADRGGDTWSIWPKVGDCDDYVVTKRHELILLGLPSGALRFVYCKTKKGEGHAVLLVKTKSGDLVLDNLTSDILAPRATGLTLVSISTANPHVWVAA